MSRSIGLDDDTYDLLRQFRGSLVGAFAGGAQFRPRCWRHLMRFRLREGAHSLVGRSFVARRTRRKHQIISPVLCERLSLTQVTTHYIFFSAAN